MTTATKLLSALLLAIVLSSCAALRAPELTKLSIGMDKETVIATLNRKPESVVGTKKYTKGTVEILQYVHQISASPVEYDWIFFYNNKLVQYGRSMGNWVIEADNIAYENGNR